MENKIETQELQQGQALELGNKAQVVMRINIPFHAQFDGYACRSALMYDVAEAYPDFRGMCVGLENFNPFKEHYALDEVTAGVIDQIPDLIEWLDRGAGKFRFLVGASRFVEELENTSLQIMAKTGVNKETFRTVAGMNGEELLPAWPAKDGTPAYYRVNDALIMIAVNHKKNTYRIEQMVRNGEKIHLSLVEQKPLAELDEDSMFAHVVRGAAYVAPSIARKHKSRK